MRSALVEEIDEGPQEVGEIGFEPRVENEARQSLDDRLKREKRGVRGGQGTRVRFVVQGSIAVQSEFIQKVRGRRLRFMVWSVCIEGQGGDSVVHGVPSLEAAPIAA